MEDNKQIQHTKCQVSAFTAVTRKPRKKSGKRRPETSLARMERRPRTHFSADNIRVLNKAFDDNQYPDYDSRERLAEILQVPESRVGVWFQNRRTRTRKKNG